MPLRDNALMHVANVLLPCVLPYSGFSLLCTLTHPSRARPVELQSTKQRHFIRLKVGRVELKRHLTVDPRDAELLRFCVSPGLSGNHVA